MTGANTKHNAISDSEHDAGGGKKLNKFLTN